jgi:hypothetical protein
MMLQYIKEHYPHSDTALYISLDNPYFQSISLEVGGKNKSFKLKALINSLFHSFGYTTKKIIRIRYVKYW